MFLDCLKMQKHHFRYLIFDYHLRLTCLNLLIDPIHLKKKHFQKQQNAEMITAAIVLDSSFLTVVKLLAYNF